VTRESVQELIGDLRHRVTVQRPVETQSDEGETIETWESLGTYWAAIKPLRGREFWQAQQAHNEVSHRVHMRANTLEIKPNYRLVFRGRVFNVLYVMDVEERRITYQILCKEVV
jgi:SPP1 family predicted phage head-tail adaptor